jgi:hypothetical protein
VANDVELAVRCLAELGEAGPGLGRVPACQGELGAAQQQGEPVLRVLHRPRLAAGVELAPRRIEIAGADLRERPVERDLDAEEAELAGRCVLGARQKPPGPVEVAEIDVQVGEVDGAALQRGRLGDGFGQGLDAGRRVEHRRQVAAQPVRIGKGLQQDLLGLALGEARRQLPGRLREGDHPVGVAGVGVQLDQVDDRVALRLDVAPLRRHRAGCLEVAARLLGIARQDRQHAEPHFAAAEPADVADPLECGPGRLRMAHRGGQVATAVGDDDQQVGRAGPVGVARIRGELRLGDGLRLLEPAQLLQGLGQAERGRGREPGRQRRVAAHGLVGRLRLAPPVQLELQPGRLQPRLAPGLDQSQLPRQGGGAFDRPHGPGSVVGPPAQPGEGAPGLDRRGILAVRLEHLAEHRRRVGVGIGGLGAARRRSHQGRASRGRPAASQWPATIAASAQACSAAVASRACSSGRRAAESCAASDWRTRSWAKRKPLPAATISCRASARSSAATVSNSESAVVPSSSLASKGSPAALAASSTRCTGSPARRTRATTASRTEPGTGRPA